MDSYCDTRGGRSIPRIRVVDVSKIRFYTLTEIISDFTARELLFLPVQIILRYVYEEPDHVIDSSWQSSTLKYPTDMS